MSAAMTRSQSSPVLIRPDGQAPQLERIHLGAGMYSEQWLQDLVHAVPSILPIADIEPGFGEAIAVAREVPCGHGFIDNLLLTPAGEIILVEVKLWRNMQARREVVAQALDYVAALGGMPYEMFEAAVARSPAGPHCLYNSIAGHPDALDEPEFVDALALNLARGRMLVLALGDGIRTEAEALAALLQSHAGSHFTFALVELATWKNGATGDILVVPNTLARTVMIERGIVRIEDGRPVVVPADISRAPQSLSQESFFDLMAERSPGLPDAIRSFLARVEPLGVYPDQRASLNIKADLPELTRSLNFGYIQKNGQLWTTPAASNLPPDIWRPYLEALAGAIGGSLVEGREAYVSVDGKAAPRIEDILPAHADIWADAVEAMIARVRERGEVAS